MAKAVVSRFDGWFTIKKGLKVSCYTSILEGTRNNVEFSVGIVIFPSVDALKRLEYSLSIHYTERMFIAVNFSAQ